MKTAVFAFGRVNPPTIGHSALVREMARIAKMKGTTARLFLSLSQDGDRNPLSPEDKLAYARRAFPDVRVELARTVFDAARSLADEGFDDAIMVVGEDRRETFERTLSAYVGTPELGLSQIGFVSVTRPAEAPSATEARKAARENRRSDFRRLCANSGDADQLFEAVRAVVMK